MEILCVSYLIALSVYHLFTGIASVFFTDFALKFYRSFYAFSPTDSSLLRMVLKPWGALAIFAGCVGLIAARDPHRSSGLIASLAALLAIRFAIRWTNAPTIKELFGIPQRRNRLNMGMMAAGCAILLSWLAGKGVGAW